MIIKKNLHSLMIIALLVILIIPLFSACEDNEEEITAYLSINCLSVFDNSLQLDESIARGLNGGIILEKTSFVIKAKTSALKFLKAAAKDNSIVIDSIFGYVRGINGLSEMMFGNQSGWLILINGEMITTGSDSFVIKNGDYAEWIYTIEAGDYEKYKSKA